MGKGGLYGITEVNEGDWRYNKMEGYGVYKGKDGKQYIGHYVNDRKEGEGEFTWPDGKRYKGNGKEGSSMEKEQYMSLH